MSHLGAFAAEKTPGQVGSVPFDARVVGVWEGNTSKALGGYRQRIEFHNETWQRFSPRKLLVCIDVAMVHFRPESVSGPWGPWGLWGPWVRLASIGYPLNKVGKLVYPLVIGGSLCGMLLQCFVTTSSSRYVYSCMQRYMCM